MTLYIRGWTESTLKHSLLINNRSEKDIQQILNQFWSLYEHEARKECYQLLDICINYTYMILKKKQREALSKSINIQIKCR